jgi:hypothetical protein
MESRARDHGGDIFRWFKTPVGEGAGVVEFGPEGKLSGGDTTFSYTGDWEQVGNRFKAVMSATRNLARYAGRVWSLVTPTAGHRSHARALQSKRRV